MNKVISVLLAVVIAFTLACSNNSNNDNNSTEETPSVGRRIKFDPSDSSPAFLEDIADTVFFVPLSTDDGFFISYIKNIYFSDSLIIIPQERQGLILIYGMDGRPVRKLALKGDGPGKVPSITHVWYSKDAGLIEVYSAQLGKILFFDLEGRFVKDVKVEGPKGLQFASSESLYVFERVSAGLDNNTRLGVFDKEQKFVQSLGPIPPRLERVNLLRYHPLKSHRDSVYYLPLLDDNIYLVTKEGMQPAYTFDIPKRHRISADYLQEPSFASYDDYRNQISQTAYIYNNYRLHMTDKYVHFDYQTGGNFYVSSVMYSKLTKEVLHFQGFRSRAMPEFKLNNPILGFMNDYCISFIGPSYRNILPPSFSKDLHEESNPVLMFFRLKDF